MSKERLFKYTYLNNVHIYVLTVNPKNLLIAPYALMFLDGKGKFIQSILGFGLWLTTILLSITCGSLE